MKKYILAIAIVLTSLNVMAQEQNGRQERKPLTEEQITEMQAKHAAMVKEQLALTSQQEEIFDKEYSNYNNILMASRTQQFKNRAVRPNSADEALATINNSIDSQIVELAAKKQMINNLKDVLSADQLMKLNRLTSGMGMRAGDGGQGDKRDGQRDGKRGNQSRRGNNGFGGDFEDM